MRSSLSVKLFTIACLGLFLFTLTSCVVVVKRPPRPAVRVEVRPPAPGAYAVWIKGHWKWKGGRRHGRWIWIPGHWKRR